MWGGRGNGEKIVALTLLVVLAIPAGAWAWEKTDIGVYWSVSGVWNTHSPLGELIQKRLRFTILDEKNEIFVESKLGEPEWAVISRLKLHDRIWTGINSDGQIEIVFDAEPSAGVELGRDYLERIK